MNVFIGIMIPLLGTSIGSLFVYFLRNKVSINIEKILNGFASGVMLSAGIFSLLIPSIELSKSNTFPFLAPSIGFILGFLFLMIINKLNNTKNILAFSVTLHNIPEGMAVGVSFAGFLLGKITLIESFLLSIGIAIQNIPEGAIISMPLKIKGISKTKSFIYGVLSGIVEPLFSLITILLLEYMVPLLPYLFSFACSCMIYVIFEELILEIHKDNNSFIGLISFMIGFVFMMILDISF